MPNFPIDPTGFRMPNSGLNMGAKHGTPIQKNYGKGMPLTEGGKKALMASDAGPEFKAAIAKSDVDSPADMHSPVKNKEYSKEAQNLLKAVPNEAAYNKLNEKSKASFDKAAKKYGLPTKPA